MAEPKKWHFVRYSNEIGFHFNPTRFMVYFWFRGYHYALVYGCERSPQEVLGNVAS